MHTLGVGVWEGADPDTTYALFPFSSTKPGIQRVQCGFECYRRPPVFVPVSKLRVCGQQQVHGWWKDPRNGLGELERAVLNCTPGQSD